jgi:hypothetical protein
MKKLFVLFAPIALLPLLALAEPVGRLFYTPTERAGIEMEKHAAPDAAMPYQGLVVRGAGRVIVWQNDQARVLPPEEAAPADIRGNVGGAQAELLRGGRIVAHPGK